MNEKIYTQYDNINKTRKLENFKRYSAGKGNSGTTNIRFLKQKTSYHILSR